MNVNKYIEQDYTLLIELSKIFTNNNTKLVNEIEELVFDFENFCVKREEWCNALGFDRKLTPENLSLIFTFWLTTNINNGVGINLNIIDKKEDVLCKVNPLLITKNIKLELEKLDYINDAIDVVLDTINEELNKKGYILIALNNNPYILQIFVIKLVELFNAIIITEKLNLRLINKF